MFAEDILVTPAMAHQSIDGFGASSAWTAPTMSDDEADLLFLAGNPDGGAPGVGLSLLRIRITPQGGTDELDTAQKAQARGVKVWAAPWSPRPDWKENTDDAGNGGDLLASHYGDWAAVLAQFCQSMADAGVPLAAISAQNEPTYAAVNSGGNPGYESCVYTAAQLTQFIGQNLGPALADAGATPPYGIMAPETQGWDEFPSYGEAIYSDPAAAPYVGIYATHEYSGSDGYYPFVGNHYWETEIYDPAVTGDPGMTAGLWTAEDMHRALTVANVNAWHYWWIHPLGFNNEGLYALQTGAVNDAGQQVPVLVPSKRVYVMGNFSRFVRPGYTRVDAVPAQYVPSGESADIEVTAYCSGPLPCDGSKPSTLVVVAINGSASPVSQTFLMNGVATGSWQSWVTSPSLNLAPGDAVTGSSSVTYTLQPTSVTTLVGSITGVGAVQVLPDAGSSGTQGGSTLPVGDSETGSSSGNAGCGLACATVGRAPEGAGAAAGIGGTALAVAVAMTRARRRRKR